MTATDFHHPPLVSAASSPSMFSHPPAVSAADEHRRSSRHLTGLGLGPVQDLTYPAWIKEEAQGYTNDQQTASANIRRLEKRRKRKAPVASGKDSKPFRCDRCNFAFDRKCNLTCHMKTHGVGRGKVVCDEPGCGKAYGRRADVNRHKRTIHQGASFVCEDCGKEFGRSDILMRHDGACHAKKNGQHSMGGSPAESDWTPTM
jgi:hypothetical protein